MRKFLLFRGPSFIPLAQYRAVGRHSQSRGPSMSVGDVVEIDGRASSVDTAGFARIEELGREQIVPGPADWLRPPEF